MHFDKNYSLYDILAMTTVVSTTCVAVPYILLSPFRRIPLTAGVLTFSLLLRAAYYANLIWLDVAKNASENQNYQKKKTYYYNLSFETAKGMIPILGLVWICYSASKRKRDTDLF